MLGSHYYKNYSNSVVKVFFSVNEAELMFV